MRRAKAQRPSGCKSHRLSLIAPAGCYRSGGGGNETDGAFETHVPLAEDKIDLESCILMLPQTIPQAAPVGGTEPVVVGSSGETVVLRQLRHRAADWACAYREACR